MPTFAYNALDLHGRARGTLTAESRAAALAEVSGRGLTPVSLEAGEGAGPVPAEANGKAKFSLAARGVSANQIESHTRELANLLSAGVPLGKALHILRREASNKAARELWTAVHDDVVGGKGLADALARWPKSFSTVYVAMVRAGEMGGFLDVVLNQIADFRARESELLGKVKAAMIYPAVLATLAVGVVIFLLTYFIPRFTEIFSAFSEALPVLTQAIVAVGALLTHYGWMIAVAAAAAVVAFRRAARSHEGRRFLERLWLRTPAVGVIVARFALVRFARMLGTLIAAGVPLVTALRVAREAIGNQTLADAVGTATDEVKRGAALSRSLGEESKLFPPSVVEMVAVAEETGKLDTELIRLAARYESDLDRRLRMLVALAEPLLLFIMAAIIGTIVVGMLLPIFTMQELIK